MATNIHGSVSGAADSAYQVTALLKGGPALRVADFDNYKPKTIVEIWVPIVGCSGRRLHCHIPSSLNKSGNSTPTRIVSSTWTTLRTAESRSLVSGPYRDLKGTSAIH